MSILHFLLWILAAGAAIVTIGFAVAVALVIVKTAKNAAVEDHRASTDRPRILKINSPVSPLMAREIKRALAEIDRQEGRS